MFNTSHSIGETNKNGNFIPGLKHIIYSDPERGLYFLNAFSEF
jgi:hypothetical protein